MLRGPPPLVLFGLYILLFARLSATHSLPVNEFHLAGDVVAGWSRSGANGNEGRALGTSLGGSNTLSTRSDSQARSDIDARSGHGEPISRARALISEFPYLVNEPSPVFLANSDDHSNYRIILDPKTSWSYPIRNSDGFGPSTPFMQDLKLTFEQTMRGIVAGTPRFEISYAWVWGTKDEVRMRSLQTRVELDKSLAELGRAGQAKRIVIDIKDVRSIAYTYEDLNVAIEEFAKALCGTTTGTAPELVKRKYIENPNLLFQAGLKPQDPEPEPINENARRDLYGLPKARSYPIFIRKIDDFTNFRIILDKKITDILDEQDPVVWWKQLWDILNDQMPNLPLLDFIELQTNQRIYVRWQMGWEATGELVRWDPAPSIRNARYRQMAGEEEERIAIDIKNIKVESFSRIYEIIDGGVQRTIETFYRAVTGENPSYIAFQLLPSHDAPELFSIGRGNMRPSTNHHARSDIELM